MINLSLFATVYQIHFMNSYQEDKQTLVYDRVQYFFLHAILLLNAVVFLVVFVDFIYIIYIAKIKPRLERYYEKIKKKKMEEHKKAKKKKHRRRKSQKEAARRKSRKH